MSKSLQFDAVYVNEQLLNKAKPYFFDCSKIEPIGHQIVRCYDEDFNIVAKSCFLIRVGIDILGSTNFSGLDDFLQYMDAQCKCCVESVYCEYYMDGCQLFFENCIVSKKA